MQKSSASNDAKVPMNDARYKAAAEYLKSVADPALHFSHPHCVKDDYTAAATKSSALKKSKIRKREVRNYHEAATKSSALKKSKVRRSEVRYYHEALMKSSGSKETKVPTNEARFKAAAEYLKSLESDYVAAAD
jgi:hypothetical protein